MADGCLVAAGYRGSRANASLEEPDQPARDHEHQRDELRPSHDPEHRAAFRIVAHELNKVPCKAVEEHVSADHLTVEALVPDQPVEHEKIDQLDHGLVQLRRMDMNPKRRP